PITKQHAFLLLRLCMIPKMCYWMRCVPPAALHDLASRFDACLLECAGLVLGLSPKELQRQDVRNRLELPLRLGGLGLRPTTQAMPEAYVSGMVSVLSLSSQARSLLDNTATAKHLQLAWKNVVSAVAACPPLLAFMQNHFGFGKEADHEQWPLSLLLQRTANDGAALLHVAKRVLYFRAESHLHNHNLFQFAIDHNIIAKRSGRVQKPCLEPDNIVLENLARVHEPYVWDDTFLETPRVSLPKKAESRHDIKRVLQALQLQNYLTCMVDDTRYVVLLSQAFRIRERMAGALHNCRIHPSMSRSVRRALEIDKFYATQNLAIADERVLSLMFHASPGSAVALRMIPRDPLTKLSDRHFTRLGRLRAGVAPIPNRASCFATLHDFGLQIPAALPRDNFLHNLMPYHSSACAANLAVHGLATRRHDTIKHAMAKAAAISACTTSLEEPKLATAAASARGYFETHRLRTTHLHPSPSSFDGEEDVPVMSVSPLFSEEVEVEIVKNLDASQRAGDILLAGPSFVHETVVDLCVNSPMTQSMIAFRNQGFRDKKHLPYFVERFHAHQEKAKRLSYLEFVANAVTPRDCCNLALEQPLQAISLEFAPCGFSPYGTYSKSVRLLINRLAVQMTTTHFFDIAGITGPIPLKHAKSFYMAAHTRITSIIGAAVARATAEACLSTLHVQKSKLPRTRAAAPTPVDNDMGNPGESTSVSGLSWKSKICTSLAWDKVGFYSNPPPHPRNHPDAILVVADHRASPTPLQHNIQVPPLPRSPTTTHSVADSRRGTDACSSVSHPSPLTASSVFSSPLPSSLHRVNELV
ncbi:MAG: hypothetical protein ACAH17_03905, partial [Candidatus Paceibacterota bacterium]